MIVNAIIVCVSLIILGAYLLIDYILFKRRIDKMFDELHDCIDDCDTCPFPKCSDEDIERRVKK